jgi:hypothetical protein
MDLMSESSSQDPWLMLSHKLWVDETQILNTITSTRALPLWGEDTSASRLNVSAQ